VIPFLVKVNWKDVLKHTVIPTIHLNRDFFEILVAILERRSLLICSFWQATNGGGRYCQLAQKGDLSIKLFMDKDGKGCIPGYVLFQLRHVSSLS